MKFTVSSTDLLKQLQKVSGAIASNPVLPILEDFLFEISGNGLKMSASNLEVHISTKMETETQGEGLVAIPAKILLDTLKALPEQPIKFEIDKTNFGVQITSAYGKYKLAGEDGADFPNIPNASDFGIAFIEIERSLFQKAIKNTLFATSNDDMRPAMTGVFVAFKDETIDFVATDAHRLTKIEIAKTNCEISGGFIIPKTALNLLKGAAIPDVIKIGLPDFADAKRSNAFFEYGDTQMVCRLIDARYPDYNAIMPKDNGNIMTIERSEFLAALKRIAIFANKTTNQVVLKIETSVYGHDVVVSAKDLDFSNEAVEQLPCFYEGEPIAIGFNAKLLVEMLSVLTTKEVCLEMSTPNRAGILLPTEQDEEGKITMLVMPVMLGD